MGTIEHKNNTNTQNLAFKIDNRYFSSVARASDPWHSLLFLSNSTNLPSLLPFYSHFPYQNPLAVCMLFPLPPTPCYQSHHQCSQTHLELSHVQVVAHGQVHWPYWQNKSLQWEANGLFHKLSKRLVYLSGSGEPKTELRHQGLLDSLHSSQLKYVSWVHPAHYNRNLLGYRG
jgi:hypothetical protein